jgi:Tol biopolymer transport system component
VAASGGGAPDRIELAGVGGSPALSASGNRLAYSRRTANNDLLRLRQGRGPEAVLASTFVEQDGAFSPDGSKIAFASDRTGEGTEVWVAAVDGSGRRLVSKGAQRPAGSPRWSPDGRRLAFDGLGDDGYPHVYVVDGAGGQPQAVAYKAGASDHVPSWSRDGKWIYFGSNRTGRFEAWRAPVADGDAQQLTTTGGDMPIESWDGRTLYFARAVERGRMLLEMSVAGGPERRLDVTTVFWNYLPAIDGLYYVPLPPLQKGRTPYEVRFLDFAAGKSRVLHSLRLASLGPGLSVSSDGETVLVSAVAEITQDLMRIENFR